MGGIERAVFIVGCGRSGTTMLASMLGAHPEALVTPESQFNMDLYTEEESFDSARYLKSLKKHRRFAIWDLDISPFEEELLSCTGHREFIYRLVEIYAQSKGGEKRGVRVWIDHTPANVNKIDILKNLFPDSLFIHIYRDGRAVAASFKAVEWGRKSPDTAALFWMQRVAAGLASECRFPGLVSSVRYEDIVLDTEEELGRLCDFIGLDFKKEMLDGGGFRVPEYTRHQHRLVGKGVKRSRVDAWRVELEAREIEIFENIAGDILRILGYERLYDSPRRIKRHEKVKYSLKRPLERRLDRFTKGGKRG